MQVFISYCHYDKHHFHRLKVHLATLKRENLINDWSDVDIHAGQAINHEIKQQLDSAELFLMLVSPDFLNSSPCIDSELKHALKRQKSGTAVMVPIIIEPCDWQSMSVLKNIKALPHDALPVSEWSNPNKAWFDVVTELKKIIQNWKNNRGVTANNQPKDSSNEPNIRIKRDFDDIDKSRFLNLSFAQIAGHFESKIRQYHKLENLKGEFRVFDQNAFSCTLLNKDYQDGNAYITVRSGGSDHTIGDIYYAFKKNAPENTADGMFYIESDGFELFLETTTHSEINTNTKMTAKEIAEQLWTIFVGKAGVVLNE